MGTWSAFCMYGLRLSRISKSIIRLPLTSTSSQRCSTMSSSASTPANNTPTDYVPPKVWTDPDMKGSQCLLNRPISGATHDAELPVGKLPLFQQLYSMGTTNGKKVTIFLEELLEKGHSGAASDAWLIRIDKGDQFGSGFVEANSKIPTVRTSHFSYLNPAQFCCNQRNDLMNSFHPITTIRRAVIACGHGCFGKWDRHHLLVAVLAAFTFMHWSKQNVINRYTMAMKRQLEVLDMQLAKTKYIAGNEYTITKLRLPINLTQSRHLFDISHCAARSFHYYRKLYIYFVRLVINDYEAPETGALEA